jgi:coenzyme Q-binding protein COQ10
MSRSRPRSPAIRTFTFNETLPYGAEQMFDLVAAVERYHEFMPLCQRARIVERKMHEDGTEDLASILEVAHRQSGLRSVLESEVHLDRNKLVISATSRKGPVKHLKCRWAFHDLPGNGSEARFYVEYEMSVLPLQIMMSKMSAMIFQRISAAFRERAKVVYG